MNNPKYRVAVEAMTVALRAALIDQILEHSGIEESFYVYLDSMTRNHAEIIMEAIYDEKIPGITFDER